MGVSYLNDVQQDTLVYLDPTEKPIKAPRVAVFTDFTSFARIDDYTASMPTGPSPGRCYRKNTDWRPGTPDQWWFFVVENDPSDPRYQLHHGYVVVFLADYDG